MCDVIFITPNMQANPAEEVTGTLQLSTILKNNGVNCEILQFFRIGDLSDFNGFIQNALKIISEKQPKIVSFYTRCDSYHIDLRLAEKIKELNQEIYIVFGGPQSDIVAERTISQIPYVDFICCGEGESTIYPFFSSLLSKKPDLTVPGLVYRENGNIKINPRPELMPNFDNLPLIDYSFFDFSRADENHERSYFPIEVGRGCPFACTYCTTKTFWGRRYRLKEPERVYREIKSIHDDYGITRFAFVHDMFTLNRDKVIETCRLLKTLDFPIEWKCSARLDCIDHELIDIMADAGMVRMFVGIETGSKRMQKLINKNLKLDNVIEMVKYLNDNRVAVTASFIYGFPEETDEDISQTMDLIIQLLRFKNVRVQTHLCTFLAGTEMTEKYMSELTRSDTYSDVTGVFAIEECNDLFEKYPDLFLQMYEYKTEMRSKLKYFKQFFWAYRSMARVYDYLLKYYKSDNIINMYYDFVDANEKLLKLMGEDPLQSNENLIIENDAFYKRFADDENYDIINDMYRLKIARNSEEVRNGGSVTDIYCFSPFDSKGGVPIGQIKKTMNVITCKKNENGKVIYKVNPLK